jgi:hypothetical protein
MSAAPPTINRLMPDFIRSCSSYHVVLQRTGFAAAVKCGVLQLMSGSSQVLRPRQRRSAAELVGRCNAVDGERSDPRSSEPRSARTRERENAMAVRMSS